MKGYVVIPALVKLSIFAVVLMIESASKLLACVAVNGEPESKEDTRYLFIQATLPCFSDETWWQFPLAVSLVLFVFIMLMPMLVPMVSNRPLSDCLPTTAREALIVLHHIASEPFHKGAANWGCVMTLHRIALAALSAAPGYANVRQLGMACVCLIALHCHLNAKPFIDPRLNMLQNVLLSTLLILSVVNIPTADALTAAIHFDETNGLSKVSEYCAGASLVILVVPFVWGVSSAVVSVRSRVRSRRQAHVSLHWTSELCAIAAELVASLCEGFVRGAHVCQACFLALNALTSSGHGHAHHEPSGTMRDSSSDPPAQASISSVTQQQPGAGTEEAKSTDPPIIRNPELSSLKVSAYVRIHA